MLYIRWTYWSKHVLINLWCGNALWKLPPSREALIHHTKWACYQAGYLWRDSIDNFSLPDPKSRRWGKKSNGNYGPLWESTQISRNEFETFISKCFCWAQKSKKCKCAKVSMKCITIVYVEENVTRCNLVMLMLLYYGWCYFIMKLFYFGLFVWILHLKYSIWHAWHLAIVHE